MRREEFIDFLHFFSTFKPLVTREPIPVDCSLLMHDLLHAAYIFLIALLMSPLLFPLWLFSVILKDEPCS